MSIFKNIRGVALVLDSFDYQTLPPLKWAGGKRWLVPLIRSLWLEHPKARLVEPFVGGLAVTLGFSPRNALLNDNNPHLISFYKWLQRGLAPETTRVRLQNDSGVYYENRERFNNLIRRSKVDTAKAAVLFYYLNRTGYNGLCRFNASGYFNVPFGKYKTIAYRRTVQDFHEYRSVLDGLDFRTGDFEDLKLRPSDFVYADPPYDTPFTQYSAGGFSWDDQVRLAKWLASHRGPVVASNQATRRILALYKDLGFKVKTLSGPRRISCTGDRSDASEILATRNL